MAKKKRKRKQCQASTSSPSSADSDPNDGVRELASEFSLLLSALAKRVESLEHRSQQSQPCPSVIINVMDGRVEVDNTKTDETTDKAGFKCNTKD